MGWLISLAIRLGVPDKYAKAAAIGTLIVLGLLAAWGAVKLHDRGVIERHDTARENRDLKADKQATDDAAEQRATDTITIAKQHQETHDAIEAQPDQPIAPTSRALGCDRLRRAGREVPACR